MKLKFIPIICLVFTACSNPEVKIGEVNYNQYHSSVRGLYMVNENIIWASGTNGIIQQTINGNNWVSYVEKDKDTLDYRDIHAFNDNEAIIMSSGKGCVMYKTKDTGKSWELVYENGNPNVFFDGMDFWDNKNGIAFSDPIGNELYLIKTNDGGNTWQRLTPEILLGTLKGEAGFAASGTGIQCIGKSTVVIGTGGGERSRLYISNDKGKNWKVCDTPMRAGEASGIYSLCFKDSLNGVVVGGNYLDSTNIEGNCAYTKDGGKTWGVPITTPKGYRSCVVYNGNGIYITCGRTGVDVSYDDGENWKSISAEGFYSCVLKNNTGWLFGRNGKYAKITIQ